MAVSTSGGISGVTAVTAADGSIVATPGPAVALKTADIGTIAGLHTTIASVPMNNNLITGLGPGSSSTDAAQVQQISRTTSGLVLGTGVSWVGTPYWSASSIRTIGTTQQLLVLSGVLTSAAWPTDPNPILTLPAITGSSGFDQVLDCTDFAGVQFFAHYYSSNHMITVGFAGEGVNLPTNGSSFPLDCRILRRQT